MRTKTTELLAVNPVVGIAQQDTGERYAIHADGTIGRPAIGMPPSGQWRVFGAVVRNNFGNVVARWTAADLLADGAARLDSIPWKHANGSQRVFILDVDHGTTREWRSPGYTLRSAPNDWNPYGGSA